MYNNETKKNRNNTDTIVCGRQRQTQKFNHVFTIDGKLNIHNINGHKAKEHTYTYENQNVMFSHVHTGLW